VVTFSEALTDFLRGESARTSKAAVSRALGINREAVRAWTLGHPATGEQQSYVMADAVVATYGLAPIADRLGPDTAIALWGACETCHERPKAARGLLRKCRACRRLTGPSSSGRRAVPS
jgi:hypothetical protein